MAARGRVLPPANPALNVAMQNINPAQQAAPGYALLGPEAETAGAPAAGRNQRSNPNWPLSEGHAAVGESLVNGLIPCGEKNYRVDARPEGRAIVGLSQGGGPVVVATNNHSTIFGYVGLFSSRPFFDGVRPEESARTEDSRARVDFEIIPKIGFHTQWLETHGAHTWITYGNTSATWRALLVS